MARKAKSESKKTGLYHARDRRRMSRSELVRRSGVSKQQLSRLENGLIRLRLDHLKPFASALGYSPEQILLWGHYPGTSDDERGNRRGNSSLDRQAHRVGWLRRAAAREYLAYPTPSEALCYDSRAQIRATPRVRTGSGRGRRRFKSCHSDHVSHRTDRLRE